MRDRRCCPGDCICSCCSGADCVCTCTTCSGMCPSQLLLREVYVQRTLETRKRILCGSPTFRALSAFQLLLDEDYGAITPASLAAAMHELEQPLLAYDLQLIFHRFDKWEKESPLKSAVLRFPLRASNPPLQDRRRCVFLLFAETEMDVSTTENSSRPSSPTRDLPSP